MQQNIHYSSDDMITLMPVSTREELQNAARHITGPELLSTLELAEQGCTRDLFALYRDILFDSQIQTEFVKRKSAILGDDISLMPWDKTNPADVAAHNACEQLLDSNALHKSISWLLNATLFPVAVVEKVFRADSGRFVLADLIPVHYQLLDWQTGRMRIQMVNQDGTINQSEYINPDPSRYLIHRGCDLPVPDQWGGPMRALLFWWLLRSMSRQWWADFIERYGRPILLGKYRDAAGKRVLEQAFSMAVRLGGLVISESTQAEIISASVSDTSNSHEAFIELCNREISKLIVGQTLSTNSQPTGIGSGASPLHGQVRDDLRAMDAKLLAQTLRSQLLAQYLAINNIPGRVPKIIFGSDSSAETTATMELVSKAYTAGLEPTDDGITVLSERSGISFQRRAAAPAFNPVTPFSAVALSAAARKTDDEIAANYSASLSASLGKHMQPLLKIIETSENPRELIKRAETWALNAGIDDPADLINKALTAYVGSGIASAAVD